MAVITSRYALFRLCREGGIVKKAYPRVAAAPRYGVASFAWYRHQNDDTVSSAWHQRAVRMAQNIVTTRGVWVRCVRKKEESEIKQVATNEKKKSAITAASKAKTNGARIISCASTLVSTKNNKRVSARQRGVSKKKWHQQ